MATIDYGTFPHIVENIIKNADCDTLIQLRRVCHGFQNTVEPILFKSLRVVQEAPWMVEGYGTEYFIVGHPTENFVLHGDLDDYYSNKVTPVWPYIRGINGRKLPGPPLSPMSTVWRARLAHTQTIIYSRHENLTLEEAQLLSDLCPNLHLFERCILFDCRQRGSYYAPRARNVVDKVTKGPWLAWMECSTLMPGTVRHTVHIRVDPHHPFSHDLDLDFKSGAEEFVLVITGPDPNVLIPEHHKRDPRKHYWECLISTTTCDVYRRYRESEYWVNLEGHIYESDKDCTACWEPVVARSMSRSFVERLRGELRNCFYQARYKCFTIVGLTDLPRVTLGMPTTATKEDVIAAFLNGPEGWHYKLKEGENAFRFFSAREYRDLVGETWWAQITSPTEPRTLLIDWNSIVDEGDEGLYG